ncbi:unnamed protein product [Effrenium voratum]|uniref:Uncharacterized protein n=1 Tax=Effrenium voratum TaxID=2562239 RepID=A0AA36JE77_9DINO|nr:unnamed protein product [Effrenium voratum]
MAFRALLACRLALCLAVPEQLFTDDCAEGSECHVSLRQLRGERREVRLHSATVDYPLANDDSMEQTYPMTDAASGYCAFPSEREDPELGSADLGGVCAMALKYAGHRAAVGTECATQTACTHCNGVWCNGKVEALLQQAAGEPDEAASSDELPGDAFPLAKDDDKLHNWPMTDAADGFCAYPSERSDPTLGSAKLGAAPMSAEETEQVCDMARKYEGHRAEVGSECATKTACGGCNGVWCSGTMKALLQSAASEPDEAAGSDDLPGDAFPLAKDDDKLHNWPMTDAADGFCAYPSERSDPTLGSAELGAAPMSAEETEQVCDMARKYEGHRAEVGSECATKTACGGCNGVWCSGTMKALLQSAASEPDETAGNDDLPGDAFPLAKDDDKLHNWPMTDAADGFCAYPSERSDPTLGSAKLGAAPMSAEETEQVCDMARKYEGHRAEVGSECATKTACGGCNGVWCSGTMKALLQTAAREPDEAAGSDDLPGDAFPLAKDDDKLHNWPMTDAADGFCAYPSERNDPTLGSAELGAAPMSAEETEQVCDMARKYEGHRAEVGSECATKTACGGCNGVWCSGTMKALLQSAASEPDETAGSDDLPGDAFPLAKDDDKLHNWPMTDAADGFCAYPSERSDPTLGSAKLGAAPMSAEETEQVCDMARKYEGHRAEVGSECATKTACGGCNGVWCSGTMKA